MQKDNISYDIEQIMSLDPIIPHLEKLPSETKDRLLIAYNDQMALLYEDIKRLSFRAYCDVMTTTALNQDKIKETGLPIEDVVYVGGRKIFNRTFWEMVYRPKNKSLEADCYILDVNNLKEVNDSMGHGAGDIIICETALIANTFGTTIRLGGDEFLLIVTDKKEAFKNYIQKNEDNIPFSYGLSVKTADKSFSDVLTEADKAMYEYKVNYKKKHNIKGRRDYLSDTQLEDDVLEEEKEEVRFK